MSFTSTIAFFQSPAQTCSLEAWSADIDGDQRDDLLLRFRDQLYTALSTGTRFTPTPASQPWAARTSGCVVADIDGDSRTDISCMLDVPNEPVLRIGRSRGDGTFIVTDERPTGSSNVSATRSGLNTGDFDGDGWSDLVYLTDGQGTKTIHVGTSTGNGSFEWATAASAWPVVARASTSFDVADFDGDGLSDLAYQVGSDQRLYMAWSVEGYATQRFEDRFTLKPAGWTQHAQFGDVDGNGVTDLVGSTGVVAIGSSHGGFSPPATVFRETCGAIVAEPLSNISQVLVDIDGDGRQDLLCIDATTDPHALISASDYPSVRPAARRASLPICRSRWRWPHGLRVRVYGQSGRATVQRADRRR